MRARWLALALSTACGRVGFDHVPDALPAVGATQLPVAAGFSFVTLAVDWSRSLAYVGTRESGHCLDVIDFAGTPHFLTRLAPPATTAGPCLGVALDATGTHLAFSAPTALERWDLGSDPRAGTFTRQVALSMADSRHVRRALSDPTRLVVAYGKSPSGYRLVQESDSAPYLATISTYASGVTCTAQQDEATEVGGGMVMTACTDDASPIDLVDETTATRLTQIAANPGASPSGFDASARKPDGTLVVMLGWVGVVLATPSQTGVATLSRFWNAQATNRHSYREAWWFDRGMGDEVIAIRDDSNLDVISLVDPANPRVVAEEDLGLGPEGYALSVSPDSAYAAVVTNTGYFALVDLRALPAVDFAWPAF